MKIPKARIHKRGQLCTEYRGKTIYFGKATNPESMDRYKAWLAEVVLQQKPQPEVLKPGQRCTLAMLAESFLDHRKANYGHDEYRNTKYAIAIVTDLYPNMLAGNFGPLALAKCQQTMVDKGWSRGYINQQTVRIRRMFKWGISQEAVPATVLLALKTLDPVRKGRAPELPLVMPADDALITAVLPYLSRTVAAMVKMQRLVGMRPAELCKMRHRDLTMDGELMIFRPESHKNTHRGRDLQYHLGPQAMAILAQFPGKPADYVFSPRVAMAEHQAERAAARKTPAWRRTPVQRKSPPKRAPGACYSTTTYRRAIRYGVEKLRTKLGEELAKDIKPFRPHQLRHSRSTEIRAAFGLEASRAALGHASIETAQIYAESDAAIARRIALETG